MLCAMVAGSALVMLAGSRSEPNAAKQPPPALREAPWLTPEAAAQIIGPGAQLGPLFEGVTLGGPAPAPAVRARIAAFAEANDVDIDLEVADGDVAAVRFSVTYSGCCGYEGADVLALRLDRPASSHCCGCTPTWINDWTVTSEDGRVFTRARVRVNRVDVRWERNLTLSELFEHADELLGMQAHAIATTARDRWSEIEGARRFRLEVPYSLAGFIPGAASPLVHDDDKGLEVGVRRGQIVEVSFAPRDVEASALAALLRARWGRPRITDETTWSWRRPDRIVTAELDGFARITIRER
jgi:hypothetical protein